jgi:hypothetical protein
MTFRSLFNKFKQLYVDITFLAEVKRKEFYHPKEHGHPLLRHPFKLFSQSDEDGISLQIAQRIGVELENTYCIEYGVQDGLETNTLIFRAKGSKCYWVGNEDLAVSTSSNLIYLKKWITLQNVDDICKDIVDRNRERQFLCLSMDLDGNDYHFLEKILSQKIRPIFFIVEINPSLGGDLEFVMPYSDLHCWKNGSSFFGGSLKSFVNLMNQSDYFLCVIGRTGINAFFVDRKYINYFSDCKNWIETNATMDYPSRLEMTSIHLGHPDLKQLVQYYIDL